MIYADNAATTKLDIEAFEAMRPYLLENYGNASQPYKFSLLSKKALKEARGVIASCINASPEEIFFTSGGTEADNWAIKGTIDYLGKGRIITSEIEHHAVLNSCKAIERLGFPVTYLSVEKDGTLSPKSLEGGGRAQLISIMLANNEIGTIEPISDLAAIAHRSGAIFHTDAVAAIGHIPVDVKALNVDMLSASGHKFNAPKGVGFLYIKKGTEIFPYADGGSQEGGLRAGTENLPSIVAMAHALQKNCSRMGEVSRRLSRMEAAFLRALDEAKIDYIRNGAANHVPGSINISIKDAEGEMLLHRLDLKGICISTGAACDSVKTQVSHVIRAVGVPEEYARGTIRVTFGADNKEEESLEVARAIIDVLKMASLP